MGEAQGCHPETPRHGGIDDASYAAAGIERAKSRPEGVSALPKNGDSTFGATRRMVEAAGIEPASESVPQKALQA
jgi:hypothetical protein